MFSRLLRFLQPLRVPCHAPASEFCHSLKLVHFVFSWKLFQSLLTNSLSAIISPFFCVAGFPLSNGSWSNEMIKPQLFMETSFHSLWSYPVNVTQFLLQFSKTKSDQRACACMCTSELSLTWARAGWKYLWSNWDTLFLQLFSNPDLPTLENTRENFQKEETDQQLRGV